MEQNEQVFKYQMDGLEAKLGKQVKATMDLEKAVRDQKQEKEELILSMHPLTTQLALLQSQTIPYLENQVCEMASENNKLNEDLSQLQDMFDE